MIEDIFSRKIADWEIHAEELAEHAGTLISKARLAEGVRHGQLVLHADNGSPMKGATMLTTLQRPGIVPSFSRPSVSDDSPYSASRSSTTRRTIHASHSKRSKQLAPGSMSLLPGRTMNIVTVRLNMLHRRSATLVSTKGYCNRGKQFMKRRKLRIHNGGLARHVTGKEPVWSD
jgi:transposase InsO family protein